jgi:hypothetical protein
MESMDHVRERFEALAQQMNVMEAQTRTVERRLRWWRGLVLLLGLLGLCRAGQAADFPCAAGDVACVIAAITEANTNGQAHNRILLAAGTYTFTAVENLTEGPNGLPSITSHLTMTGAGADATILEHETNAPPFRLGHVAATGSLTLDSLSMRGFGGVRLRDVEMGGTLLNHGGLLTLINSTLAASRAEFGGGIANQDGTVTLAQTLLTACIGIDEGGGIFTDGGQVVLVNSQVVGSNGGFNGGGISNFGGTVTLFHSQLRDNDAEAGGGLFNVDFPNEGTAYLFDSTIAANECAHDGAGIFNSGTMTIHNSTIVDNMQIGDGGGGILNFGTLTIHNSTIARNVAVGGAGISTFGPGGALIINSTIADNQAFGDSGGGIAGSGFVLLNTLLARNTAPQGPDCSGTGTSLGTNLIGDPTGCTMPLQPTDLTGDPGLGAFTDNGTPGNGHIPLRRGSPAIDAGNDAACPPTDQRGQRRVNIRGVGTSICDIGAIEFPGKDARPHDEEDDHHDKDLAATVQASQ